MRDGDVASILVIRKEQFERFTTVRRNNSTAQNGLVEYDYMETSSRFFRTTISDIEEFNTFIRGLGLVLTFEKLDTQVDAGGPIGMKMLFVKVGAHKINA